MGRYMVSERRATLTARFCRSSLRYQSRRDPLTGLRQRMRELAQTRVRFGYRRLLVLLRREGWRSGRSDAIASISRRASRFDGSVPGVTRRRSTASSDAPRRLAMTSGAWTSSRTKWPRSTIPRADHAGSIHARMPGDRRRSRPHWSRVAATLERLRFDRGLPQRIYCDNGTEFVSAAMDLWA